MTDRLSDLEARVGALVESLRDLERRIAAIERTRPALRRAAAAPEARDAAAARMQSEVAAATRYLSLVGRTLLVLAGAYLLRALTDSGTLPAWLGVALGFAYAGTWIAAADRAAARGRAASAGFHGAAAVAIGFPLLYEAIARFRLLTLEAAAATLAAFVGVGLAVAWRRRQLALAWLVSMGAIPTAYALMMATGRMAPALLDLVALGAATLWIGYVLDWRGPRWVVAAAVDVGIAMLALRVVRPGAVEGPAAALVVQVAFVALTLGSIAIRTIVLDRDVVAFEVVQTGAVLLLGLGGASFVVARAGLGEVAVGAVSVAFGLAAYGVAFNFIERRPQRRLNCRFYAAVGILFVLAGTSFVLPEAPLALVWSALAVVAAGIARRTQRLTLAGHAAAYAIGAAIASGLVVHAAEAAFAPATSPWSEASASSVVVLAAMLATAWLVAAVPARTALERIPRLLLLAAIAASAAGLAIGWAVPAVGGAPGPQAHAGTVATVRTGILAAGALALAWAGRSERLLEARWLAYPVLAVTGLKILLEDLPRSRPATLFLTFALYGAALIVVPRLRRRAPAAPAP